jgi:hypothetical protein
MKRSITLFAVSSAIGLFLSSGWLIEESKANSFSKSSRKSFDFANPSRRDRSIITPIEDPNRSKLTGSRSSGDFSTPSPFTTPSRRRGLNRTPSEDRYQNIRDRFGRADRNIPFALSENLDPLRNGYEIKSGFSPYSENGQFSLDPLPGLGLFYTSKYFFSDMGITGLVTLLALAQ